MGLMTELAQQELKRQKGEAEAVKNERYRTKLWLEKAMALWSRLEAGIKTRLSEYNSALPALQAYLPPIPPTMLEIIKDCRARQTVGRMYLSTSPRIRSPFSSPCSPGAESISSPSR